MAELTLKAVVSGVVLGIVFGAANAYLGLRVGLTVSASIPVAVMTVAVFRAFRRQLDPRSQPLADDGLGLDLARHRDDLHDPGALPLGRCRRTTRSWCSRSWARCSGSAR